MLFKICGLKDEETVICCEQNKVDFFGMIFYEKSPRNIDIIEAKKLTDISNKLKIQPVGVFVNHNIDTLKKIILFLNLKFIQLHGEENQSYIDAIKSQFDIKIIKKISIRTAKDLNKISKFKNIDYLIFDYKPNNNELPGGNSKSFDWNILKNLETKKPWFLSGGINTNNIEKIINDINPFGIDLSSGVEKGLGIKDNHIINNFIRKLKNA